MTVAFAFFACSIKFVTIGRVHDVVNNAVFTYMLIIHNALLIDSIPLGVELIIKSDLSACSPKYSILVKLALNPRSDAIVMSSSAFFLVLFAIIM